jgi:undecaprenyl-diphosphatase
MNDFDAGVFRFLSQFAQKSPFFDNAVNLAFSTEIRGVLIIAAFWWAWFRGGDQVRKDRELVVCGMTLSIVGLVIARTAAFLLPYRERPYWDANLHFRPPIGDDLSTLIHWSSFPSDHAVFYFCLATAIFFVSKKVGSLCIAYVILVICFPRVYEGAHYATDVIAGGLFGIAMASLALIEGSRKRVTQSSLKYAEESPGMFYAMFFIISVLFALQFDPLRHAIELIFHNSHQALSLSITHFACDKNLG